MKSGAVSLSQCSDGTHHSQETPQISLYLSTALIPQNNSPKSLSVAHSPPPFPLHIIPLCHVKMQSQGLYLHVLCSTLCIQSKQSGTGGSEIQTR